METIVCIIMFWLCIFFVLLMNIYRRLYKESCREIDELENYINENIGEIEEKAEKYDEIVGYIGEDFLDGTWDNGAFTDKNGRRIVYSVLRENIGIDEINKTIKYEYALYGNDEVKEDE